MQKIKKRFRTEIQSYDRYGEWSFNVLHDGTQIQLFTESNDQAFVDTDIDHLIAIRDLLTEVIDDNQK